MKLNVPAIERIEVGYRYAYRGSETIFYDNDRPNILAMKPVHSPVYDYRATSRTVFDYDFKLKRRLLGVAATAGLLGIAAISPVVITAGALIDLVKTTWRDIKETAVLIQYTLGRIGEALTITTRAIINP